MHEAPQGEKYNAEGGKEHTLDEEEINPEGWRRTRNIPNSSTPKPSGEKGTHIPNLSVAKQREIL